MKKKKRKYYLQPERRPAVKHAACHPSISLPNFYSCLTAWKRKELITKRKLGHSDRHFSDIHSDIAIIHCSVGTVHSDSSYSIHSQTVQQTDRHVIIRHFHVSRHSSCPFSFHPSLLIANLAFIPSLPDPQPTWRRRHANAACCGLCSGSFVHAMRHENAFRRAWALGVGRRDYPQFCYSIIVTGLYTHQLIFFYLPPFVGCDYQPVFWCCCGREPSLLPFPALFSLTDAHSLLFAVTWHA